jgi:hypothetical protein
MTTTPALTTALNKNDKKAVKRAVQWLRDYVKMGVYAYTDAALQANEIARALEQVLERDQRTRDNAKLDAAPYSIKEDMTGWEGYCRNTRVKQFGDEAEARAWLEGINK